MIGKSNDTLLIQKKIIMQKIIDNIDSILGIGFCLKPAIVNHQIKKTFLASRPITLLSLYQRLLQYLQSFSKVQFTTFKIEYVPEDSGYETPKYKKK